MNIEDLCDAWCMNNALNLELLKPITIHLNQAKGSLVYRKRQGVEIIDPRKVISRGKNRQEARDQTWEWGIR